MEEFIYFVCAVIALIITIVFLIHFFRLCKDTRAIREILEDKCGNSPTFDTLVVEHRGRGSVSPSKSDVREFHDRIKEYRKTHKDLDQQWLENLIEEYNDKFSEDFHQYL